MLWFSRWLCRSEEAALWCHIKTLFRTKSSSHNTDLILESNNSSKIWSANFNQPASELCYSSSWVALFFLHHYVRKPAPVSPQSWPKGIEAPHSWPDQPPSRRPALKTPRTDHCPALTKCRPLEALIERSSLSFDLLLGAAHYTTGWEAWVGQ